MTTNKSKLKPKIMSTTENNMTATDLLNEAIKGRIETNSTTGVILAPGQYAWLYAKPGRSYVVIATDQDAGFEAKIGVYTPTEGWVVYNKVIEPFQGEPVKINQLEQDGVYVQNMSQDHGSSKPSVSFSLYPA
jgi:hypothetical protein